MRRTVWAGSKFGASQTATGGGRNCWQLSRKSVSGCTTLWSRPASTCEAYSMATSNTMRFPGNLTVLSRVRRQVARYWFRALGQRSQRRPIWDKLGKLFDQWLPVPKVVHEFPDARFRRQPPWGGQSKVRTVCGSTTSTGLCGGWPVTAIPTATISVSAALTAIPAGHTRVPWRALRAGPA